MRCTTCGNEIIGYPISAARQYFCSDICHLRFWKDELPNLGGRWISEEDIKRVQKLGEPERKEEYYRISAFILNHLNSSTLMLRLQYNIEPDPNADN